MLASVLYSRRKWRHIVYLCKQSMVSTCSNIFVNIQINLYKYGSKVRLDIGWTFVNVDPLHPRHGTCFHDSIWHCDGVDSVHDTLEKIHIWSKSHIVLHTEVKKTNYSGYTVQIAAFNPTVKTPCHMPISFLQSNTLTSVSPKTENAKTHKQRGMLTM